MAEKRQKYVVLGFLIFRGGDIPNFGYTFSNCTHFRAGRADYRPTSGGPIRVLLGLAIWVYTELEKLGNSD